MRTLLLSILIIINLSNRAEKKWNLQDCISYALENNIKIKNSKRDEQIGNNKHNQTIYNLLPEINSGITQSYINDKFTNIKTGIVRNNFDRSNELYLSSTISIFNGFEDYNRYKKSKLSCRINKLITKELSNNISINVTFRFLRTLLMRDLHKNSELELKNSKLQLERTELLFEVGKISKSEVLQISTAHTHEKIDLLNSGNNLKLSLMELKQLLNINDSINFKLDTINIIDDKNFLYSLKDIYKSSLNNLPEIKISKLNILKSKKSLDILKAKFLPKISISAGYSSRFSSKNPISFRNQFDNYHKYISVNLAIPIFNKFKDKTKLKNQRIEIIKSENLLLLSENKIFKDIKKKYLNAILAKDKYNLAKQSLKLAAETFNHVKEKFNLGLSYSIEYNSTKNLYSRTKYEVLQTKYEYLFKRIILQYYSTGEVNIKEFIFKIN